MRVRNKIRHSCLFKSIFTNYRIRLKFHITVKFQIQKIATFRVAFDMSVQKEPLVVPLAATLTLEFRFFATFVVQVTVQMVLVFVALEAAWTVVSKCCSSA